MEIVTKQLIAHFSEIFDTPMKLDTTVIARSYDDRKIAPLVHKEDSRSISDLRNQAPSGRDESSHDLRKRSVP